MWRSNKQKKTVSNGPTKEQVQNIIKATVATVSIVKDLVPIEPVKGSLGALCGMLNLLQMYLENGDDLSEIAERCQQVAVVVKRAAESDKLKTDVHLLADIEKLQKFVDKVCQDIEQKQKRGVIRKLFSVHGDAQQITDLKETLRDFLQNFQVHLELTSRMDVIEILEWVKAQPIQPAGTQLEPSTYYYTPPKPSIFFGREDTVTEIIETVKRGQHVMLIGTGGIGKSSVAKAVLNDNSMVSAFKARLFITYDGIASSAMSYQLFLDHIASALNLPTDNAHYGIIMKCLHSLPALLVIDNAETFLDASAVDGGRIAEMIDAIGALESICIIVTTRNHASVSANFQCKRMTLSGIPMAAACQAFSAVYTVAPVNKAIKSIFTALEYHPLSVNILANAASMNEWSPEEIVKAWDERQAGVLENADDKYRSLRVTTEISISSLKKRDKAESDPLNSVVLQVLRAIAFLPQGIHRDDFRSIFSTVSDIYRQVEAIQRSSLIYRHGERVTMLAPIRMYIADQYNKDLIYGDQVISVIRDFLYAEIRVKRHHFVEREHGNIERHLLFDMRSARYHSHFGTHLWILCQLRIFLEYTLVPSASIWLLLESETKTLKPFDGEENWRLTRTICDSMRRLCWIDMARRRMDDCLAKQQVTEAYCHRCSAPYDRDVWHLVDCLRIKASVLAIIGSLPSAAITLREGISTLESVCYPEPLVLLQDPLARILFMQGEVSEAKALLASLRESYSAHIPDSDRFTFGLLYQAWVANFENRPTDARLLLEEVTAHHQRRQKDQYRLRIMACQASCEGSAGDFATALKILQEATEPEITVSSTPGTRQLRYYLDALEGRAYYEARLGYLDNARKSIVHAMEMCSNNGERTWTAEFVSACIESFAGERHKAISIVQIMQQTVESHMPTKKEIATVH